MRLVFACATLITLAACSSARDGELEVSFPDGAIQFDLVGLTSKGPDTLHVVCNFAEDDEELAFESAWEIFEKPLAFPIVLGELPSGAKVVAPYQEPLAGADCTAFVMNIKKNGYIAGADWSLDFNAP